MAQTQCTTIFSPTPAVAAGYKLAFTVTPSDPTCAYSFWTPFIFDLTPNGSPNIYYGGFKGTNTFTFNASMGSGTIQEYVAAGTFPLGVTYYTTFVDPISILPITDPSLASSPPALETTTPILPDHINGQVYAPFQLMAVGGTPPYTWQCSSCTMQTTAGISSSTPLVVDMNGLITASTNYTDYGVEYPSGIGLSLKYPCLYTLSVRLTDSAGLTTTLSIPFKNYPTNYTQAQLPAVALLDPTPLALTDPSQSLMTGNQVTADMSKLDTLGRAVQGIAADGTAEIVLRIPTNATNDIVAATVMSDTCTNSGDPSTCSLSTSAAFDGGLIALSNAANPVQAAPVAPDAMANSNKFAYVIYRAPVDFVRLGNASDQLLDTRSVIFKLAYRNAQGVSYGTQYIPLTIVRPPVVLTHGYASSAVETWSSFDLPVAHTSIYEVDYSAFVRVAKTTPGILCESDCVTVVRESDLGVTYNTPGVAQQSVSKLRDFALGNNLAKVPVAVSQLDSIAHSMGGLIERYWSTNAGVDPVTGNSVSFRTPDNFGAGYIHKLITLGTPNYGSPFATESIVPGGSSSSPPGAACFRDISALEIQSIDKPARYIIGTAILGDLNGTAVGGAVGELDGDGIGTRLSAPLQLIKDQAAHLPTFNIAGDTSPGLLGLVYTAVNALCGTVPSGTSIQGDPVASRMTYSLYGTLFDPTLTSATEQKIGSPVINDGVVSVASALLGRTCNVTGTQCFDAAHGEGTQKLLGTSQNLPDDKDVQSLVNNLLNTSLQDAKQWVIQ